MIVISIKAQGGSERLRLIKTISLVLVGLHSLIASAGQDEFNPYQVGSVYNLNTYLPWVEPGTEIVNYPAGCSVNTAADFALQLFFPDTKGPFSEIFHSECVRHDYCYRHGYYTYEFTKNDCDDEFAQSLESRCKTEFSGTDWTRCRKVAELLILAARKFGHLSYHATDYVFRDYGYYYEYLDNKSGQYALFWSLLDPKSERYRALYRHKVNNDRPLPATPLTHRLLVDFFRKKIALNQLIKKLKDLSDK